MIFDTLNNLPNYLGISPHLDTAIEYIMARDIATLPEGRTRVDGAIRISILTPQSGEKADFVCREGCLTLLTDLAGSEMFEVSLGEFAVKKPAAGDAPACGSAPTSAAGMLCEGRFALFLAGGALQGGHQGPGLRQSEAGGLSHRPGRGRRGGRGNLNLHPYVEREGCSMKIETIETPRLALAAVLRRRTSPFAISLWNDPVTGRWLSDPALEAIPDIEAYTKSVEGLGDSLDCCHLVAVDRATGQRIGTCSFVPENGGRSYDIAYADPPDFQRRATAPRSWKG